MNTKKRLSALGVVGFLIALAGAGLVAWEFSWTAAVVVVGVSLQVMALTMLVMRLDSLQRGRTSRLREDIRVQARRGAAEGTKDASKEAVAAVRKAESERKRQHDDFRRVIRGDVRKLRGLLEGESRRTRGQIKNYMRNSSALHRRFAEATASQINPQLEALAVSEGELREQADQILRRLEELPAQGTGLQAEPLKARLEEAFAEDPEVEVR